METRRRHSFIFDDGGYIGGRGNIKTREGGGSFRKQIDQKTEGPHEKKGQELISAKS